MNTWARITFLILFTTVTCRSATVITNGTDAELRAAVATCGPVTFSFDGIITLTNSIPVSCAVTLDATGHAVTLSGGNNNRLFQVSSNGSLTLVNLRLSNGRSTNGGAIYNEGTVIAQKCQFIGNTAIGTNGVNGTNGANGISSGTASAVTRGQPGQNGSPGQDAAGGAIYSIGSLDLTDCYFNSNSVFGGKGGTGGKGGNAGTLSGQNRTRDGGDGGLPGAAGNARGGCLVNLGTLVIQKCIFSNSLAVGGTGGTGGSGGTKETLFAGIPGFPAPTNGFNQAGAVGGSSLGGAIYSPVGCAISDCSMVANESRAGNGGSGGSSQTSAGGTTGGTGGFGGVAEGGGVFVGTNSALNRSTLSFNRATGGVDGLGGIFGVSGNGGFAFGGGIVLSTNSSIINCTLATNSAAGGTGGTAFNSSSYGVFGGNGGDAFGGGLAASSVASATNITVAGNSSIRGLATETNLMSGGFPSFLRGTNGNAFGGSIATTSGVFQIVNSILAGGVSNNCFGSVTDLGHNISSDATPTWTSGTSVNNTDALLQPLADNGGPTLTMALAPGSPALSNADPASSPAMDQRGVARPLGGGYDIGAFEGPYTPPLYVLRSGGSAITLHWAANAGQTYRVNVSSNLVNWTPFSTNTAISNGWLDVPVSANSLLRFFRLSSD